MNCTYCGAWANTRDHVMPLTVSGHVRGTFTGNQGGVSNGHQRVPCCLDCNVLLGDRLFTSVETRAAYLIGALSRRYKKLLKSPQWTSDELEELEFALRKSVEGQQTAKLEVSRRIEYCHHVVLYGVEEAA